MSQSEPWKNPVQKVQTQPESGTASTEVSLIPSLCKLLLTLMKLRYRPLHNFPQVVVQSTSHGQQQSRVLWRTYWNLLWKSMILPLLPAALHIFPQFFFILHTISVPTPSLPLILSTYPHITPPIHSSNRVRQCFGEGLRPSLLYLRWARYPSRDNRFQKSQYKQ